MDVVRFWGRGGITIDGLGAFTSLVTLLVTVAAFELARLGAIAGDVALSTTVVASATTTATLGTVAREVTHWRGSLAEFWVFEGMGVKAGVLSWHLLHSTLSALRGSVHSLDLWPPWPQLRQAKRSLRGMGPRKDVD
jgi:hypothetical protein